MEHVSTRSDEEGATSTPEPKLQPTHSKRDSGFAEHASTNERSPTQTMVPTTHTSSSYQRSPRRKSARPPRITPSSAGESIRSSRTASPASSKATPKHHRAPLGTQCIRINSYTSLRRSTATAHPHLHIRTRSSISSGASSIVYARPYTAEDPFAMHRACVAIFNPHPPTPSKHTSNETASTETSQDTSTETLRKPQKPISWLQPQTRAKQYENIDKSTKGLRGAWRRWAPRRWQKRRLAFYEQGNGSEESVRRYRIDIGDEEGEN